MNDFIGNKILLVDDLLSYEILNNGAICLFNFLNREIISLNQIYEGKEMLLHKIAKLSQNNHNVCILFSKISLFELPIKIGAFVLDCGMLLGFTEQGRILESNVINVFETSAGRLGILIYEDIYEHNIFYYLESLDVDLIIILCGEEEIEQISKKCDNITCAFLVKDKILFNKM